MHSALNTLTVEAHQQIFANLTPFRWSLKNTELWTPSPWAVTTLCWAEDLLSEQLQLSTVQDTPLTGQLQPSAR